MKYLKDINREVVKNGDGYKVVYTKDEYSGSCEYMTMMGGRFQPFPIQVLTGCDMGGIIEYINGITPLSERDFEGLNREIREDSLVTLNHHQRDIRI
jgi:hypothetical protein